MGAAPIGHGTMSRRLRRAGRLGVALGLLLALAAPARAAAGEPTSGPRLWLGPALALDPAFAAGALGGDWFFSRHGGVGVTLAHTLGGAGDQLAAESGYGFADLVARLREGDRLRLELLAGAGVARVRFGSPGAHTELAPDLVLGGALGWGLAGGWDLAVEVQSHITLGERAAARNAAHTSELLIIALRWGA
jgi:hypothetical protein